MKVSSFWLMSVALCAGLVLAGCSQATGGGTGGSSSGPVSGKISGQSFTTTVAVAHPSSTIPGDYDIILAGTSATPYVFFSIAPQPQTYTVTLIGSGLPVIASVGGTNYVGFDSGTVTITKIDTTAKQITGQFTSVVTTDKTSSLSGTFTATIQ